MAKRETDQATAAPQTTTKAGSVAAKAARYQRVALMLQGGGALGSYQLGVYKALAEAQCLPSWICGVSIGAINGALIAGNAPEKRLERLEEFWSLIAHRSSQPLGLQPPFDFFQGWGTTLSSLMTMALGQKGFFAPRALNPWFAVPDVSSATSFYATSQLRDTLLRLVDFDRLNSGETRLSVGAVNVATGNNVFFDTAKEKLTPEHIMASGALPPALPMVQIGDDFYWDGGIVSNTPLQYLLDQDDDLSSLVFQVDLFSAKGQIPTQMMQVMARHKDITYSSRTRQATTAFKRVLSLRALLADALKRVPENLRKPGEQELMRDYADAGVVNLIQLIYQGPDNGCDNKDYEFSRESMLAHVETGYADTLKTLARSEWFDMPEAAHGVVDHDIHRG
jgi:NTE family protein